MARTARSPRLENRTQRATLKARHQPYWVKIGPRLSLGYRKGKNNGTWIARFYADGEYKFHTLGDADDLQDAAGNEILGYFMAADKARKYTEEMAKVERQTGETAGKPVTVEDATVEYLRWFKSHRRSYKATKDTVDAHILPTFGKTMIADLTARKIARWLEDLADAPPRLRSKKDEDQNTKPVMEKDPDYQRRRRSSANRVFTVLKAILNFAYRRGLVGSDDAWRRVKSFHNVDSPRIRYLTEAEVTRLLNSCEKDFRCLVQGALLTAGRYGELVGLTCADYNPDSGTVNFKHTKNGRPRHIPITKEGQKFFERIIGGRAGEELMFVKVDGEGWGGNHQSRRLKIACVEAKVVPPISFHILRHTVASLMVMKGVPMPVISEVLGHSDGRVTSRHYAHLAPSYVADVVRANMPSFGMGNGKNKVAALKPRRGK